ncbi:MAG TPA: hypothetical protein VFJ96_03215 [Gemmatimonadaceae bacterium]|nr:hypothetical protein [Gemmatimonadaceae bacterium]
MLCPGLLGAQSRAAPERLDQGRFTVVAYPRDDALARSLLASAMRADTFPGLPRPRERVLIAIAPDMRTFRQWVGPGAPEWGAAIAMPDERRIVMQGSSAGSDAGDPVQVLRHELAHLALHEFLGDLPPRWFDEGYASYAAGEWGRNDVLAASVTLALRGVPPLDSLDAEFYGGATRADAAYALSYRAVAKMASLDPQRGLALFFSYWKATGSIDQALRRAYGLTQPAFEQRWQSDARLHYGALALFANLTLAFLLVLIVVLPLYMARRRRDRERLALLRAADEAAERAERERKERERLERERAIEELLRESGGGGDVD